MKKEENKDKQIPDKICDMAEKLAVLIDKIDKKKIIKE
jgi:hypothetical protein